MPYGTDMPYGLYLAAEGAHAQAKRLEVIANNLANVDTVGFKRELAVFQARYAEETERGLDLPGSGSVNDVGGGVLVHETKTDFAPGPLKTTGLKTDMAIEGAGFFVVQKDGQNFLTRAGNFYLNERGELVTQYGQRSYAVMSEAMNPIVIDRVNGEWQVASDGTIRQPGAVQQLAIVEPTSYAELERVGENLFQAQSEPQPVPLAQRNVRSGYLEASSVQPTTEMIKLIETSRAIEANVKMMQSQDQLLSELVTRVMRS